MTVPSGVSEDRSVRGPRRAPTRPTVLVGRERELVAAVAAVVAPPSVVVLEGEAGIGKTRLVSELREHPEVAGRRLVVGACRPIKEPFPLGAVLEVVQRLRDPLATAPLSPVVGALRPLLPELAGVLPALPDPLGNAETNGQSLGNAETNGQSLGNAETNKHWVFRALREVLGSVGPVTVVLEDLHWADELTVDLLRYLVGDLPAGLSLVLTTRTEGADPGVRALTSRLPPPVRGVQLVLASLDEAQTGQLAAGLLEPDLVTAEVAAYLRERTGGVPFAIEELAALLRGRGVAALDGRRWSRQELDRLGVPAAVSDHVLERVSMLPASVRALLDLVAVLQSAPESLIAQLTELSLAEVAAGLSHAVAAGLLVDEDGDIAFRHVLAAQAVYDGLPGPRRRELHGRAADLLASAGAEVIGRVAFHLRQAGRLAEWAPVAERAADQASELGQVDEAARLLEEVLRHAPIEAAAQARLAVKLGRAARATLRPTETVDLLAKALAQPVSRDLQSELRFLLGTVLDDGNRGQSRVRALVTEVVADAAAPPEVRARAMVTMEMRRPAHVSYEQRHRYLTEIGELIDRIADPDRRLFLLGKVGLVQVSLGDPRWREAAAEAASGESAAEPGQVAACESIGVLACFVGHHLETERLLQRARSADLHHDEKLAAMLAAADALLDYCCGRWEGLAQRVAVLGERLAYLPRHGYKLYLIAGDLAMARGDLAQAADAYQLMEGLIEADCADLVPMLVGSRIRLALARRAQAAALAIAEEFIVRQDAELQWPAAYRALPWLAEVLSLAGQPERARELSNRYAERVRGREAPLEPAARAFADGFTRTAASDHSGAAAAFLTAAEAYDTLMCPYEAAQAREAGARSLADAGRGDAAESPLRAAIATYQGLGALRELARAKHAARRSGFSVPTGQRRGPRGYGNQLSPRELEVAQLVTAGLSNKQVAAQLFLSVETVKQHLQSAIRKLGAPSRAALARYLPPDRSR